MTIAPTIHVSGTADATASGPAGAIPFDAAPWPENLDTAVAAYEQDQNAIASKELEGSDPVLYPIRSKVRPSVEPLLGAFDAQLADVENRHRRPGPTGDEQNELNHGRLRGADSDVHSYHKEWLALQAAIAQRGTMTAHGYEQAKRDIAANRKAAVTAALEDVRKDLDVADAVTRAQRDDTRLKPTAEDVETAVDLMLRLERTTPKHGTAILAEWIADAAKAKDAAKAAAVLPMLKSLHDGEGPWRGSPELRSLVERVERLTRTWQGTVFAARLERIAQTRYDLDEYAKVMLGAPADRGLAEFIDGDGNPRLFPEEPEPVRRVYEPRAPRKPVRMLRSKRAA